MARNAVCVVARQLLGLVSGRMLVEVVSEMVDFLPRFVTAIPHRRPPDELNGQQCQQEDDKGFAHEMILAVEACTALPLRAATAAALLAPIFASFLAALAALLAPLVQVPTSERHEHNNGQDGDAKQVVGVARVLLNQMVHLSHGVSPSF
jgi:hypothetical protein